MSIITDALKKAEHDRELKAKRVREETAAVGILTEEEKPAPVFSDQTSTVETQTEKNNVSVETKPSFFQAHSGLASRQFKEILILVAIGIGCFAVLFLLPAWPSLTNHFSITWKPFQNGKAFQVGSLGGVLQGGVSAVPVSSSNQESRAVARLPFVLSGISVLGEDRYTVINNKILQEGDSIDGAFVRQIMDREVILETRNGEIKLKFPSKS